MNKVSVLIVLYLSMITLSCAQKPKNPTPPKDHKALPIIPFKQNVQSEDYDPYFHETNTIKGTTGPLSITRNIIQDDKGVMWFASWEGIMSFDGKEYTNYTNRDSLRRFHMFSVYQDSKGGYWFGSVRAGLYRYDGETWENLTSKDVLTDDIVSCFIEDSKGNLCIGTSKGLVRYDWENYEKMKYGEGLFEGDVNDVVEDKDGVIWIGTRDKLYTLEERKITEYNGVKGESLYNVRTIIRDKKDRMWFGGNSGLWVIDGEEKYQVMKDFVGYIYEDKEGKVYAGVANGAGGNWTLNTFESKGSSIQEITKKELREQQGQIFGIMKDKDGVLWYGHERGVFK